MEEYRKWNRTIWFSYFVSMVDHHKSTPIYTHTRTCVLAHTHFQSHAMTWKSIWEQRGCDGVNHCTTLLPRCQLGKCNRYILPVSVRRPFIFADFRALAFIHHSSRLKRRVLIHVCKNLYFWSAFLISMNNPPIQSLTAWKFLTSMLCSWRISHLIMR